MTVTPTPAQELVITFPRDGGHLLVEAAPGSGKTFTICRRIEHLLSVEQVDPWQIVALSYTRRAAGELQARITGPGCHDIFSGTVHAFCADLLHRYGAAIDIPHPLRICDEQEQALLIGQATREAVGWLPDESWIRSLAREIERRKRSGRDDYWETTPPNRPDYRTMALVDAAYTRLLKETGRLDFDDLVLGAIRLLESDEETARIVHNRYRYLFIDEFHDISPEQYAFLHRLMPPRLPGGQVLAVADPDQAIFGFRGANARRMLARYQFDYQPHRLSLCETFRCPEPIAQAAAHLIAQPNRLRSTHPGGEEITCWRARSPEHEAEDLAGLVERAHATGGYDYGDMAIIYRTHKRADLAEQALLQRGIPIHRIQRDRFFHQPEVREALRYLDLFAAMHDRSFEPALNWPRVIVDEVTMIRLRRIARTAGVPLSDLVTRPDLLEGKIGPLARVAIDEFRTSVAGELAPLAEEPITTISERLLALLTRRRDPLPRARHADLLDTLAYLGQPLQQAADALHAALAAGRPVAISHAGDLDCIAGAVILRWVCERYFQHPVADRPISGAFVIALGAEDAISADGVALGQHASRTATFGVAARAWRLGQMVLMRSEVAAAGRIVVIDIETTSTHANSTEVLEVAAQAAGPAGVSDRFASLVQPRSPASITRGAQEVHGIRWEHVKNAPAPAVVLPALLAFLGDATLAGHNIDAFDVPVLDRIARQHGFPPLANPTLDTYRLAERLLPNRPHALADLANHYGISVGITHRAEHDVALNCQVLDRLLADLASEKERGALTEALPLVALGTLAAGLAGAPDNDLLVQIGARARAFGQGQALVERLAARAGRSAVDQAGSVLHAVAWEGEDDTRWASLQDRWHRTVEGFCRSSRNHSLTAFLDFAALAQPGDLPEATKGRVTMLTVHSAKGQEWPLVFLLGVDDDQFPLSKAQSADDLDEERRILYVGMTRAQRRLVLLWSARTGNGAGRPSRFLDAVPPGLLTHRP